MQYQPSKLELFVNLVKAIIWPVLVFYILLSFSEPIGKIFNNLSQMIPNSSKISVAGVTIETNQQISEVQKDLLKNISPESIRVLIEIGNARYEYRPDEARLKYAKELNKNTLANVVLNKQRGTYGVFLTPNGLEAYRLVQNIFIEILKSKRYNKS